MTADLPVPPEAYEAAAAIEHERWSHWQRWMHDQCTRNADGTLTIPAGLVERWERQIATPYAESPRKGAPMMGDEPFERLLDRMIVSDTVPEGTVLVVADLPREYGETDQQYVDRVGRASAALKPRS